MLLCHLDFMRLLPDPIAYQTKGAIMRTTASTPKVANSANR
jgi:hypothetical protein